MNEKVFNSYVFVSYFPEKGFQAFENYCQYTSLYGDVVSVSTRQGVSGWQDFNILPLHLAVYGKETSNKYLCN